MQSVKGEPEAEPPQWLAPCRWPGDQLPGALSFATTPAYFTGSVARPGNSLHTRVLMNSKSHLAQTAAKVGGKLQFLIRGLLHSIVAFLYMGVSGALERTGACGHSMGNTWT